MDNQRIDFITAMVMFITGMSETDALNYIKNTIIYDEIVNGDEITLQDSFSTNLYRMSKEFRNSECEQLKAINVNSISNCNNWMMKNKVESAAKAKVIVKNRQNKATLK